jgi:hypothetical protein
MRVSLTVGDTKAHLGNKGITFHIADNAGKHVGKLRIAQATVEWCEGRTRIGNGRKMALRRFIAEKLADL